MRISPAVVTGMVVAAVVGCVVLKDWARGEGLPPHEFAYGAALPNSEAIPDQVDRFLSLDAVAPDKIRIQTYVGDSRANNLTPLIGYISTQKSHDFGPLVTELKNVDQLQNQKEKAVQLVKTLLPYKDSLRNESQQDTIIVFAYYGLQQPSYLSQAARVKVNNLVSQLDTAKQSAEFDFGECPKNYLVGNINIYPLGLDNTFWHKTVEFDSSRNAPVLEIRFMGLKGIFRYLLDEMTRETGDSFIYLDGESL
jgi:hypothetical protein